MADNFSKLDSKMRDLDGVSKNASRILRRGDLIRLYYSTGFSAADKHHVDHFLVESIDGGVIRGKSLDLQRDLHRDTTIAISYPEGHEVDHNKIFLRRIEIITRGISPEGNLFYLLRNLFFELRNLKKFGQSVKKLVDKDL